MLSHIRAVGILHVVFSSLTILIGLGLLVMFGGLAALVTVKEHSPDGVVGAAVLGGIGLLILVIMLVVAVPGMVAGIALLRMKPWSRVLTIVVSALELMSFPFGTALGLYGLWVMLQPETERLLGAGPGARAARV
jgi:hypothetical protein